MPVLLLFSAGQVFGQVRREALTIRIKTSAECQICKKRIEDYLKREPGLIYVNLDYHNKIATVRYYTDVTNPDNIRTAIANAGYDADTVAAEPDSYRLLPSCCKKGGMAALKAAQIAARKAADQAAREKRH